MHTITLHEVEIEDMAAIFSWRNTALVRQFSFNTEEISWMDHEKWFKNILQQPDKILLIGKLDGSSIGVLRFDLFKYTAEVNIYLVPGYEHRGLGVELLKTANDWLIKKYPVIKQITAKVLHDNIASHKAFKKAGFNEYYQVYQFIPTEKKE